MCLKKRRYRRMFCGDYSGYRNAFLAKFTPISPKARSTSVRSHATDAKRQAEYFGDKTVKS